ncbi:uncharacterized protein LOC132066992 [Lycium ferocissimum]|uniref:uncharacterized protein LOC132066992 n=1 Tax=Lycium ferocissimum TaxID=112874 RepID=UPI002815F8E7|nr:uncharacterized protein LOC132066992 [Lycium ferocissimum]
MASLEAQRLLERIILDYMSKRGFNQTGEVFSNEIRAKQNLVAINSPHEAFLQKWWVKFYEAYRSSFPDDDVLATESFDKVAQTVESIVANNSPANQSYASYHTGANISNVMPSPHLMASMESSVPDLMNDKISDILSSLGTGYALPDLSGLQFPEISEMGGVLPFASNLGYQMQQTPTVPPKWNARGVGSIPPVISHQVVHPSVMVPTKREQFQRTTSFPQLDALPNVAVQTLDNLKHPAPMLGDTNQRISENLQADQQSTGKQPAVQSDRKRKTPSSSLPLVGKEKNTAAGLVSALESFTAPARAQAEREGLSFKEINNLHATNNKLLCCHFNSQGDLLATAGQDRKVLIWELGNDNVNSGEGHAHFVTDIRFRPDSMVFATSSFDRTVKIWDAAKPSKPFQNLAGHAGHVMSIDFHPTKVNLLSSCDSEDEIRLWDVNKGDFTLIFKGGSRQVRFQPQLGDFLASSTGNIINIFDVQTNSIQKKLQGHIKDVRSICWDMSGNYMASVSEDSARIWSVCEGKCIHELCSSGNKFQSCTFHPGYAQLLVIGSDELLELWNPIFQSNITRTYSAHTGIISSLADSPSKGTIASVSHDEWIKIWQ